MIKDQLFLQIENLMKSKSADKRRRLKCSREEGVGETFRGLHQWVERLFLRLSLSVTCPGLCDRHQKEGKSGPCGTSTLTESCGLIREEQR